MPAPKKRTGHGAGPLFTTTVEQTDYEPRDLSHTRITLKPKDLIYTHATSKPSEEQIESFYKLLADNAFLAIWHDKQIDLHSSSFTQRFCLYWCMELSGLKPTHMEPPADTLVCSVFSKGNIALYKPLESSYVTASAAVERRIHKDPTAIPFAVSRHVLTSLCPPKALVYDPFPKNGSIARAAIVSGHEIEIGEYRNPDHYPQLLTNISKAYDKFDKDS